MDPILPLLPGQDNFPQEPGSPRHAVVSENNKIHRPATNWHNILQGLLLVEILLLITKV